ncbi:MAG TPA: DUF5916 domain-containing protein, partial [Cyclobacteriaceae bacterium]|nr:DUF5916 domain-containing protein [Cyclobacteriaceae bacterium]
SSERYFQRPDNHHADVDSARRSLTGTGGNFIFGKRNGDFVFDIGYNWSSPELELNDIGFLAQTDQVSQWSWFGYRKFRLIRNMRAQRYNFNQYLEWDFDGRITDHNYNVNAHTQFKNFWGIGGGATYVVKEASNADLRGGPQMRYPGNTNYFAYVESDPRKKFSFNVYSEWIEGFKQYVRNAGAEVEFVYRPTNALNISVTPSVWFNTTQVQYVETVQTPAQEARYILGSLDQKVLRLTTRLTYMLTPNLSVQYYGQLFGTSGEYRDFKYVTNSHAAAYENRFALVDAVLTAGRYETDEDNNGTTDYSFGNPDFNFGQFRSNMVIRWEYIPGSTLFVVWNQQVDGAFDSRAGSFKSRMNFDFSQRAHNIFLIKYTYRFIL